MFTTAWILFFIFGAMYAVGKAVRAGYGATTHGLIPGDPSGTPTIPDIPPEADVTTIEHPPISVFDCTRTNGVFEMISRVQADPDTLPLGIGVQADGQLVRLDLATLPHLLVAGSSGSGKSVALHSMIAQLVYSCDPSELQLALIDMKRVEFTVYNGIPHLSGHPVATEVDQALYTLQGLCVIMDHRFELFEKQRVRDIAHFNRKMRETFHENAALPRIVLIVDELADLFMTPMTDGHEAGKFARPLLFRLAQKARAAGIHVILATQRPSSDVVPGILKVNFPAALCFRVRSATDSRVVLDEDGAEALTQKGEFLLQLPTEQHLICGVGAFISPEESDALVAHFTR